MNNNEKLQLKAVKHQVPSWNYFSRAKEFNVRCIVLDRDMGLYVDKYVLKIEGDPYNIESFKSYLRYIGFNIDSLL